MHAIDSVVLVGYYYYAAAPGAIAEPRGVTVRVPALALTVSAQCLEDTSLRLRVSRGNHWQRVTVTKPRPKFEVVTLYPLYTLNLKLSEQVHHWCH